MDYDRNPGLLKPAKGGFVDRQGITPADEPGCGLMDGLQAKLHPYRFYLIKFPQQVHHVRPQAVRSGCNGQGRCVRVEDSVRKHSPEMGERGIGVGIGLEVGDIGARAGHFPLYL